MTTGFRLMLCGVMGIAYIFIAKDGLADNARTKDVAGFSEVHIPQITGSVPLKRTPESADPKILKKAGLGTAQPNQPVTCGPDNSQSQTCREAVQSR
jgi:hypothetical protein